MDNTILLALIGLGEAVITSVVTFLLTRRKYKTEVKGSEIQNDGMLIDNDLKDLQFYIQMVNDNKLQLKDLLEQNQYMRREVADMRTVVFGMLSQICTDMMCQNRKFDQEQCPYYEMVFKLNKEEDDTEE